MERVEVKNRRVQGWLTAAALYGVFGALIPYIAATPLGWLGALLGALPGVLLPKCPLPYRWERWVYLLRRIWSVPAMALSLKLCAEGIADYTYPGWNRWVPALLILAVGWRGSRLDEKGQERLGKLMVWLMLVMTMVLVVLILPRLDLQMEVVRGWEDVKGAGRVFLLTLGAVSMIVPSEGRAPGTAVAVMGSAAGGICTLSEGAALAGMMRYPFLMLCDAAAFEMRLSSVGTAMWALTQSGVLVLLLARFPGGKAVKACAAAGVLLLAFALPWSGGGIAVLLIGGGVLGYLPPVAGMIYRRVSKSNYI